MSIKKKNTLGEIHISNEAIASVVADSTLECYGVVGIASKGDIKEKIYKLLTKKEYSKGIFAQQTNNEIVVSVYIVVAFGCKVTEVLSQVQKKVKYVLEKTFETKVKQVNVYVQALQRIDN